MSVTLTKVLRKMDAFGYPVNLYYQSKDTKMRSLFGTIATFFTMAALAYYFVYLAMRIQDPEHQNISQYTFTMDLNEEPGFVINRQGLRFFFVLRNQSGSPLDSSYDINEYLDISFYQMTEDWYSESVY